MTRYVAFLRGINVGGRIVVKATLENVFAELGFNEVFVYKQSGNIIFNTTEDVDGLAVKIETALRTAVGFEVFRRKSTVLLIIQNFYLFLHQHQLENHLYCSNL
jgi:uncharacterized protein (DUF1697 family)